MFQNARPCDATRMCLCVCVSLSALSLSLNSKMYAQKQLTLTCVQEVAHANTKQTRAPKPPKRATNFTGVRNHQKSKSHAHYPMQ